MPTKLSYTFQPAQAFVATSTNLTFTITNPLGGNTILFSGGPKGDEIDVYFPVGNSNTDLVTALQFTATSNTPGFTCAKSAAGDYFIVRAPAGASLTPGSQVVIVFNSVTINPIAGQTSVTIKEYIGATENDTAVVITKLPQELGIIAWLQPWTVGQNQMATLYWQSMGGTFVQISGFPDGTGTKTFPVQGNPPYPGNTDVGVLTTESQRTYTVAVYTSDNQHKEVPVTLTQHSPLITSYTSDRSGTISVADTVQLEWSLLFAASNTLQTPAITLRNPISPTSVVPGNDMVKAYQGNYASMPNTASYVLTAYGYQNNPSQGLSFQLAPVQLAYFKFSTQESGGLSGIIFKTIPAGWIPTQLEIVSPTLNVLTIFQPGQTSNVYYLGSGDTIHPQIQYFNAADDGSGQYKFSWVTANLKALVLNPGSYQIGAANIQQGSQTLSLTAGQYILTGTGTNGDTIQSVLDVPYTPPGSNLRRGNGIHGKNNDWEAAVRQLDRIPYFFEPNSINIKDIEQAVSDMDFDNIWKLPHWRMVRGTIRIEVKGAISGGGRHWQIHVNGIKSDALVSDVLVEGRLKKAGSQQLKDAIVNCFRKDALLGSMNSRHSMELYAKPLI